MFAGPRHIAKRPTIPSRKVAGCVGSQGTGKQAAGAAAAALGRKCGCCCHCRNCRCCRHCAPVRGRTPPKRSSSRSACADVLSRAAGRCGDTPKSDPASGAGCDTMSQSVPWVPGAAAATLCRKVTRRRSGPAAAAAAGRGCRIRGGGERLQGPRWGGCSPAAGGREQAAGAGAAAGAAGAGARGSTLTCPNVNRCTDVTLLRRTRQGGPRGDGRTPQPKLRCKALRARLGTFPYVSLEAAGVRGGWAVYLCHFVKGNEGLDNGGQELCVFGRAGD